MELVSVVVPAFNAEKWIKPALRSVVNQSYTNVEIVMVDDASTDNTECIAKSYLERRKCRYKYVVNAYNVGVCASRNRGVECSSGSYILFLDCDDLLHRDCAKRLLQVLAEREDAVCAFGRSILIDEKSYIDLVQLKQRIKNKYNEAMRTYSPADVAERNPIGLGSGALVRRELLCKVEFNKKMSKRRMEGAEDWLFYFNLSLHGNLVGIEDILVGYRQHGTERISDNVIKMLESIKIFENEVMSINAKHATQLKKASLTSAKYLVGRVGKSGDFRLLYPLYKFTSKYGVDNAVKLTWHIISRFTKKIFINRKNKRMVLFSDMENEYQYK